MQSNYYVSTRTSTEIPKTHVKTRAVHLEPQFWAVGMVLRQVGPQGELADEPQIQQEILP